METEKPYRPMMSAEMEITEMERAMRSQPAELRRLLTSSADVEECARRIAGRQIVCVGTGTSLHAAHQGVWLLRLAGVRAAAYSAADLALWGPRLEGNDAVLVLSHRGRNVRTAAVLQLAREAGALAFSIGGIGSGAEIETTPLEKSETFTASHLGALLRMAQLAVALGANLDLPAIPAAVARALETRIEIASPARGIDFVGSGINQWSAAEGALKVREAAHCFAAGFETEQLLHGAGYSLNRSDALVCLDGGGPGCGRLAVLANAIEATGVPVHRFAVTGITEDLSIFPLTAVVQGIALALAQQNGTDPDRGKPDAWSAIPL